MASTRSCPGACEFDSVAADPSHPPIRVRNDLAWDADSERIIAAGDGREKYVSPPHIAPFFMYRSSSVPRVLREDSHMPFCATLARRRERSQVIPRFAVRFAQRARSGCVHLSIGIGYQCGVYSPEAALSRGDGGRWGFDKFPSGYVCLSIYPAFFA